MNDLRARVEELRDAAVRGEQVPVVGATNPLPWQLTKRAKAIVNSRVVRIIYPHLTPTCSIDETSFIFRGGCWRTASKLQALLVVLVPSLRGFVRPVRTALRSIVLGLRILEGQTYSVNDLQRLGLRKGCHALAKGDISRAKKLIIEGLSMLEGCCPVRKLVPALHCLVHYADGAKEHGILRLYWMMCFGESDHTAPHRTTPPHRTVPHHLSERFNKKCKNLTANKRFPFESLANSLVRDATSRYHRWRLGAKPTRHPKVPKTEVSGASKAVCVDGNVTRQMRLHCCRVSSCVTYQHTKAIIGGKQFTADEKLIPGCRCGSVVTSSVSGRSMYGLVKQFVRVVCKCLRFHQFAVVAWFPRPTYPDADPLTVRISLDSVPDVNNICGSRVISLYDIEPARVAVDLERRKDCMFMMRLEGLDTME